MVQVGCQVRFTLTVLMRGDLQQHCKITYYVHEHTGHVGPNALACHRRQRYLSPAVVQHVAQGLVLKLPIADIIASNITRVERAWNSDPHNADRGKVRFSLSGRTIHTTSSGYFLYSFPLRCFVPAGLYTVV
jgi:hypothetical protein